MDSGTRNALLVAAVAILALGVSAATLSTTTQPDSDGAGSGGGGFGPEPGLPNFDLDTPEQADTSPAPLLSRVLAALLLLSVLGAVVYAILYRRRAVLAAALGLLVLLVVWIVMQLLGNGGGGAGVGFGGGGGFGDGGSSSDSQAQPAQLFALVFVVGALAVAGVYLYGSDDPADQPDEPTPEEDDADEMAQVGAIAGRAADRIEAAAETDPIDNQVYRAYREMTTQLDIDHGESTTPREFADAAATRGMAASDVAALTDLFEEVRYGGSDPTADREAEATATLRRIEQRYADE